MNLKKWSKKIIELMIIDFNLNINIKKKKYLNG